MKESTYTSELTKEILDDIFDCAANAEGDALYNIDAYEGYASYQNRYNMQLATCKRVMEWVRERRYEIETGDYSSSSSS